MGHGREVNTHPQRLGFPSSEQDSLGLFTHCPQTPQRSFQGAAAGTHATPAPNRAHSGLHGETRGVLDGRWYHYPRSVLRGSETLRGRDLKRQTLPLLGLGRGCSRRTQKACGTAMRLCASLFRRRRGPAGLRDLFCICRNCGLYALCSGAFRVCEARGGITTLGVLCVFSKRRTAACKSG